MEPLKEMFNKDFYSKLSLEFKSAYPSFDSKSFLRKVNTDIEDLSLNQRMRRTSVVLNEIIPLEQTRTVEIMKQVISKMPRGYTNLLFPDYIGLYGHEDFNLSMDALKHFTKYGSSEFAIREFLKRDFKRTIKVMETWSKDKDHHVRRLASEGSRPRLPWSFKLDEVVSDPSKTIEILENLKSDKVLYVKKSVANHLNDYSKEHSKFMLDRVSKWDMNNPDTSWIIKHACRTLIKKGDVRTLSLFGFKNSAKVKIENLRVKKDKIRLGDYLDFEFQVCSESKQTQKLVIDYVIHYRKKSEGLSAKVFKLKEMELGAGMKISINKRQLIQDFTTRKHYTGEHFLEISVNGNILGKTSFLLQV